MRQPWYKNKSILIGIGVAAAYFALHRSYTYGGPDFKSISRDPYRLVPAFADQLEKLFQRMRALGFDPLLYEAWRSPARAKELATKGTGIVDSMHIYGGAADIVSAKNLWSDPTFFKALGREAKALGLTWGGDFSDGADMPHIQAVPGKLEVQFKALTPAQRQTILVASYARVA